MTALLNQAEDMSVVSTAYNGQEVLDKLQGLDVDLILADIHMPKLDGIALLEKVRETEDPPVFVSITALSSDSKVLKIIELGGAGYILKSQPPEDIITSIRAAMNGGVVVAPHAMRGIAKRLSATSINQGAVESSVNEAAKVKNLSEVEKDVLTLLCRGLGNQEIAEELFYSESMIKKYVSQLMRDFNVGSRLELVVSVMNRHWEA